MRIQFEFSEDAVKELDALRKKLNTRSRGQVLNNALGVLKWVVKERSNGGQIIVKRKDGTPVEVVFPDLESVRPPEETA